MSRILILACSATKRNDAGLMPALYRYDGPAFRTLRANTEPGAGPSVFILSARYGLIGEIDEIRDYDERMTRHRAAALVNGTAAKLEELEAAGKLAGEILFYGGEDYRWLIKQAAARVGLWEGRFAFTRGGIGGQLGQLKAWLRRKA